MLSMISKKMKEKGYIPLAADNMIGIGWEGTSIENLWMWNRQYVKNAEGKKELKIVKVENLKDAALHFWRDNWVPIERISDVFLREMENSLRNNMGLKKKGIIFPSETFLDRPAKIDKKLMSKEVIEKLNI